MFGITGSEKKQIVGLAVTPNLGLEACVYNKDTDEILKYGKRALEYNIASKEIQDINAFRSAVADLFEELEISKDKSTIYLVLPNVHFGFRSLEDSALDSEAIESMILSDATESYVFKQEEPISAWVDMNAKTGASSKYIAHSSLQRRVVDGIQDAVMDLGAAIAGIESSVTAIPRGIFLTKICDDVITNNENWDILLINPNGYAIFQMSGNRILDYTEVPFAIMSFEGEEVYAALSSSIAQYLPNYPAKKLVITSLTENVSARVLKDEIVFDHKIISVDSNKYGKASYMTLAPEVNEKDAASMSLSVLGACVPKAGSFATLNVLGDISYDGVVTYGTFSFHDREYDLTSVIVQRASMILSAAFLALTLICAFLLFGFGAIFSGRVKSVTQKIENINKEIDTLNSKLGVNISTLIRQINDNNKTAINYYDSLSSDIPTHVWLTYYINKDGKGVGIEGYSLNINDIYEYYKSLKILAPQSDIRLNKLEVFKEEKEENTTDADSLVLEQSDKPQMYSFEISNTSYTKTFDENGNKAQGEDAEKNAPNASAPKPKPADSSNNTNDISSESSPTAQAGGIPNVPDVEINLKEIR